MYDFIDDDDDSMLLLLFNLDLYQVWSFHEPVCSIAKRTEAAICVCFLQGLQQSSS